MPEWATGSNEPCFLALRSTAAHLIATVHTGFRLRTAPVTTTDLFDEINPGGTPPELDRLVIHGRPGHDDLGLTPDARLVVSSRPRMATRNAIQEAYIVRPAVRHGRSIGAGIIAALTLCAASLALVIHEQSEPHFSDVTPGYPMPDASAAAFISYFGLRSPLIPYTYSGSMNEENGPTFRLNFNSQCSKIIDFAEANRLARVNLEFIGDGMALTSAFLAGWQYVPGTPLFGRDADMHNGAVKFEMIVIGSGAKCQGYFGASFI